MSMVNFQYGSFKNLPQTITNGTIYVTKDEKAMYIDLDGNRIRVGQIISLTTEDWQKLIPPYSQEGFYYLTDSNALLKYNGTEWIQLNSTADIKNCLKALGFLGILEEQPATGNIGEICTVNGQNYIYIESESGKEWVEFGSVGSEILEIKAKNNEQDGKITILEGQVQALGQKDTSIEANIDLIEKVVGYVGSGDTLPASANEGDIFVHNGTIKMYGKANLSDTTLAWHTVDNESLRIEALRKRIEDVAALAGDETAINEIKQSLQTLSTTTTNHIADKNNPHEVTKAQVGLDKVENYAPTEMPVSTPQQNAIDAAKKAILGTKDEKPYEGTVGQVATTAAENATNIATLQEDINDLKDTIENDFQAADAMVYQGTIEKVNDLPTQVAKGWTYKVVNDILKSSFNSEKVNFATVHEDELYVRTGDLFIATGTEGEDGFITEATLKWDHIPSGYNADYVPELGMSWSSSGAEIQLTSAHAASNEKGDLGAFQLVADANSAIKLSNPSGSVISIGIEWESFD